MSRRDNGGVTSYTVTEVNGRTAAIPVTPAATSAMTPALTPGTAYSFTVTATNGFGTGSPGVATTPLTATCGNRLYSLSPTDSVSIQYGSIGTIGPDDSLYAYRQSNPPNFDYDITGWMKFDLSMIPKSALVQSLVLDLNVVLANQGGTPILQVLYSSSDGWTRRAAPGPSDIPRTAVVSIPITSPSAPPPTFHMFVLEGKLHDFTTDLADGTLTLGITSVGIAGYDLYSGSDPPAALRPILQLTTCE